MDGVIFKDVNFWMKVHEVYGTLAEGKILTKKYLHIDYHKLVEEVVVKLWKGLDAKPYYDLVINVDYIDGAKNTFEFLKTKRYKTAIISAGSIDLANRAKMELGVDYVFANELVITDGKISGEFNSPIGAGHEAKAVVLRNLCKELGISEKECVYIGDSNTDIDAFKEVGLSIAFNSSSDELKKAATYTVDTSNLLDILKYVSK